MPQPTPLIEPKARVQEKVSPEMTPDREGNGRREQTEPEIKRNLSEQEFDDAIKVLEEFPGLKSNDLHIKVEESEGIRTVLVVDSNGKVVRRLSEAQLWAATRDKDRQTGRILDKAM